MNVINMRINSVGVIPDVIAIKSVENASVNARIANRRLFAEFGLTKNAHRRD